MQVLCPHKCLLALKSASTHQVLAQVTILHVLQLMTQDEGLLCQLKHECCYPYKSQVNLCSQDKCMPSHHPYAVVIACIAVNSIIVKLRVWEVFWNWKRFSELSNCKPPRWNQPDTQCQKDTDQAVMWIVIEVLIMHSPVWSAFVLSYLTILWSSPTQKLCRAKLPILINCAIKCY